MSNNTKRVELFRNIFIGLVGLVIGLGSYQMAYAQRQKTHIRFNTWDVPASITNIRVHKPMLELIKKKSNGEITYTMFEGAALGTPPEAYDVIKDGLADIGHFVANFTRGRFPLSEVLSMATAIDSKLVVSEIARPVLERFLYKEFEDVKVLQIDGCISGHIWTTKKPIHTLEDLKGLRIRTSGGFQTQYTAALGAKTVMLPPGEIYMALRTGAIDGLVTCPMLFNAHRFYEVIKYGTLINFGCVTEGHVANLNFWKKVPEGHKTIIKDVIKNPYAATGTFTKETYVELMKVITDNGVTLYTPPPDERERWHERFRDVTRKWVAELEGKGLPARETLKLYHEECKKKGVELPAFPPEWD